MDVIWRRECAADGVALQWLGQAGFAVRHGNLLLLIDPYLSDSLAKKYRGMEFPHTRMMPSPVDPSEIRGLNYVLCSHRHSDHMDPETLPVLAATNLDCRFIVPRAEINQALDIGLNENRLIAVSDGDSVDLDSECTVEVIPSAHEELRSDENGNHHYLGFVLRMGSLTLYHSG
ncbi:MAG: MBL fold metallo-hydrolase, partial [Armatimonadota bacterium]